MIKVPSLETLEALFAANGGTDFNYLRDHYPRFETTWRAYAHGPRGQRRGRMLDIGSHWLHQTLLWRLQGFEVTATDIAATIEADNLRRVAEHQGIVLLCNASLEHPTDLDSLPDNSFDLILLAEVIEHLAFNPVALWRQLYRLMAPGGVLVLTTPNYYALRGRAWQWGRFIAGRGGGLSVREILTVPSFGHHWREFALAELREYITLLSLLNLVERTVPPLRDQLYFEIGLPAKQSGIVVSPNWHSR